MSNPVKRIPISSARHIAKTFGQRQVILVTFDGERTHVVTYGKNAVECDQAAQGGDFVKKALGWPESLKAMPCRVNSQRLRLEQKADGFWLHVRGEKGKSACINVTPKHQDGIVMSCLKEAVAPR